MKKSKKAIQYIFEDKYFYKFLNKYFEGLDPYKPKSWGINPKWGFDVYNFNMDEEGATKVNHIKNADGFILNLTQKDDDKFYILVINEKYGGIILWILDIIGLKYEDMNKFDPYKYNIFNEYITRNE